MPRLPAKQREAEKVFTPLAGGGYAASANDVPARLTWNVSTMRSLSLFPLIAALVSSHTISFHLHIYPGSRSSTFVKLEWRPTET